MFLFSLIIFCFLEKGICRGTEMELKLKTPGEIVEANAGFRSEISVSHIGENMVEEELVWGVDSRISVPPHRETIAELVILEDHQTRYQRLYCIDEKT